MNARLQNIILISAYSGLLIWIGYGIARSEHYLLFPVFALLFIGGVFLSRRINSLKQFLIIGIVFRLLLLFATPNLSDDYFRFAWDGRLWVAEEHPFLQTPAQWMGNPERPESLNEELYAGLNSKEYHSIYPSLHQVVFYISSLVAGNDLKANIIVMRLILILGEIGTMWLLGYLLHFYFKPIFWLGFYAFNPMVILEVTGNLHFEGLMLFFMALAVTLLLHNKNWQSALSLALAVSTKLLPLIALPVFIRQLGWKKGIFFSAMVMIFSVLSFLPLWHPELWASMSTSLDLYFRKFEFNGSIYLLVREYGFYRKGFNIIADSGPALAALSFFLLMSLPFVYKRKWKISGWLCLSWTVYLLLSTTVHPWYILPLLFFGILSGWLYPLVWSFLIFFTYLQYPSTGYVELPWLMAIEYIIVLVVLLFDLKRTKLPYPFSISKI
jgi:alpha-1,6-mannosyltransferase